jgi:diguanylate cyclase (GGDEF)-like protein
MDEVVAEAVASAVRAAKAGPDAGGARSTSGPPGEECRGDGADLCLQPGTPDLRIEPDRPDLRIEPDRPDLRIEPDRPDLRIEPDRPDLRVEPDAAESAVRVDTPELGGQPGPRRLGADAPVTRLAQVADLAKSLAAAQRMSEVVEAAAVAAWQALAAASVSVGRLDARHGTVTVLRNVGELGPDEEAYRMSGHPFLRTLVDEVGTWRYAAGQEDRDEVQEWLLAAAGRGCAMVTPIVVGGRVWGGLYVTRRLGRPMFDEDDVEVATVLAAVVGAGLAQVERVETFALLAQTDPMTGLANRRGADEALEAALAAHRADGAPLVVVLCDVDGLKRVNDTFGHPAGDLVLTRVSALLSVASADLAGSTAARVGGDEFCLVVPGIPLDRVVYAVDALASASRLLPFGAGVSCGIASVEACRASGVEVTARQLFRLADAAQYRAKRSGGVRVAVIGPDDPVLVGEMPPAGEPSRTGTFGEFVTDLEAILDRAIGMSPVARLTLLAETAASRWCAAGWAVATVEPGATDLVTRATALSRGGEDSFVARKLSQAGQAFSLSMCSLTAAAVRGGCFHAELADPDVQPAVAGILAAAGYGGMIAAGATDDTGTGWFVELYTDAISVLPHGADEAALAASLRSLVALALHPGTGLRGSY